MEYPFVIVMSGDMALKEHVFKSKTWNLTSLAMELKESQIVSCVAMHSHP